MCFRTKKIRKENAKSYVYGGRGTLSDGIHTKKSLLDVQKEPKKRNTCCEDNGIYQLTQETLIFSVQSSQLFVFK